MTTAAPAAPAAVEAAPIAAPAAAEAPNTLSFGDSLDQFFSEQESGTPPAAAAVETPAAAMETTSAETPAEVETPVDPLSEIDDLKDWTPQAARRFKELKAEAKQQKIRAAEAEAQLSQREARLAELEAAANDPRVQDLTTRASEYENAMLLNDLERSPAYQKLVTEPLVRITTALDTLAAKYSVDGNDLIDAVVMEDGPAQEERLTELLAGASDRDKYTIFKLIEETRPVLEQRDALHANSQEAVNELRELESQRERASLAERAQLRTRAAGEIAKRIETSLPFLTTFDGVDIPALAKQAGETDYTKLDPAIGTYNTIAGQLLPKLANNYMALQRELSVLAGKLAKYDKTGSPLGSGHAAGGLANRSGEERSFEEAVNAAFGG